MKQRDDGQNALAAGCTRNGIPGPQLLDVCEQVEVRQHGGFGHTSGAAGVLEHRDIVMGIDLDGVIVAVVIDQVIPPNLPVVLFDGNNGSSATPFGNVAWVRGAR